LWVPDDSVRCVSVLGRRLGERCAERAGCLFVCVCVLVCVCVPTYFFAAWKGRRHGSRSDTHTVAVSQSDEMLFMMKKTKKKPAVCDSLTGLCNNAQCDARLQGNWSELV
jgi:hypothetical protein